MSDTLQVADLVNGKLDLTTTAQVNMVDYTADTTTNRNGDVIDTLEGRLKKLGFEPPLPYAAGITFTDAQDAVKSFDEGGIVYGCLASSRPFTTTGNFVADKPNFFVIQDTNGISGNVRNDSSNTYAPGTTQAFAAATADTMSVGGVDVTTKNNQQDEAIERPNFLLSFRDVLANEWGNYKSIKLSKPTSESNPDSNSASLNIKGSSAYKIITKSYAEGIVTGSGSVSLRIEIENIAGSSLKTLEFISVTDYRYDGGYGSAAISPTNPTISPTNNLGGILLSPMLLDNSGELSRKAANESCIDLNVAEPSDELQIKISLSNQGSNGTIDKALFTVSVERCDYLP